MIWLVLQKYLENGLSCVIPVCCMFLVNMDQNFEVLPRNTFLFVCLTWPDLVQMMTWSKQESDVLIWDYFHVSEWWLSCSPSFLGEVMPDCEQTLISTENIMYNGKWKEKESRLFCSSWLSSSIAEGTEYFIGRVPILPFLASASKRLKGLIQQSNCTFRVQWPG